MNANTKSAGTNNQTATEMEAVMKLVNKHHARSPILQRYNGTARHVGAVLTLAAIVQAVTLVVLSGGGH